MNKIKRRLILIGAVTAVSMSAIQLSTASAYSGTCRPSMFGSPTFLGEIRYSCPDGSYTLRKQPWTSSWNDPLATYELRPSYGAYGSSKAKCRYQSWSDSYRCS